MATTCPSEHARQSRVPTGSAFGCFSPSQGQTDLEPLAPARAGATAGRVRAERAREPRGAPVRRDERHRRRRQHLDVDLELVVDHVPGRRRHVVDAEMRLEHQVLDRPHAFTVAPYISPPAFHLVGLDDVGREAVADLERRPVPAPHPPVAITPRVVPLAPPLERDALPADEQLAVHDPGVLVVSGSSLVGIGVVVDGRGGFPLEVEADGQTFADLAPIGVAGLVEPHAERLEAQAPVLHRRLAHALGPQAVRPDLERVAAGQRHLVVAHDDQAELGRHDVGPVPRDLLVRVQPEADVPAGAVGAREVEVPRLVPIEAVGRVVTAFVAGGALDHGATPVSGTGV